MTGKKRWCKKKNQSFNVLAVNVLFVVIFHVEDFGIGWQQRSKSCGVLHVILVVLFWPVVVIYLDKSTKGNQWHFSHCIWVNGPALEPQMCLELSKQGSIASAQPRVGVVCDRFCVASEFSVNRWIVAAVIGGPEEVERYKEAIWDLFRLLLRSVNKVKKLARKKSCKQ